MAESPGTSTPGFAASPSATVFATNTNARPSLCMKPVAVIAAPSPANNAGSPVASLTSREWIVPPRPKPGRKPATDTPPTKRKAQNRAAQRAFRERRAARVGELEEQMKQVEEEHEQEKEDLRLSITKLEADVEQYRIQIAQWAERYRQLEGELSKVRLHKTQEHGTDSLGHDEQILDQDADLADDSVGCGRCTLHTQCQCIDDAFNAMSGQSPSIEHIQHEKRLPSTDQMAKGKRIKVEPSEDMEIDFTNMYPQSHEQSSRPEAVSPSSAVADPCGFCQDGTPCICAEMAAEQESRAAISMGSNRQITQFTPPPSEGDVVQNPPLRPTPCTSGPGTCAQCRADPNSTIFCKTLAASRAQSGNTLSGCCGGGGREGGCCQDSVPLPPRTTRSRAAANKSILPPVPATKTSVMLTCADAYTTLSRHPAYEQASGDLANWMPKLHPNPAGAEGRPAMEIDAANVMAVLRDFDRRFGADR